MAEQITPSATIRVPLQAYLSSDHVSAATGKTIAITISKNGAAYGNPSGGATNAVEIASGSYYVDLSTTDTGTTGPLFVLGTASGVDNIVAIYDVRIPVANVTQWNGTNVASPATAGIPDINVKNMNNVAATAITTIKAVQGLTTADTIATYTGNTPQTGDAFARLGVAGVGLTNLGDSRIGNLDAAVSSRLAASSYTAPPSAATIATTVFASTIDGTITFLKLSEMVAANLEGNFANTQTGTSLATAYYKQNGTDVAFTNTTIYTAGVVVPVVSRSGVLGTL